VTATVFTHYSDYRDPRVHVVGSVLDALKSPDFSLADVHIFEFGIAYGLFDAVFLLRDRAVTVAVYHNVTPLELVEDPTSRPAIERSLIQKHNLDRFHLVSCISEFNRDDLVSFGMPRNRISVLHLPPALQLPRCGYRRRGLSHDTPVELLFVGRFVRAKGIPDLLDAIDRLNMRGVDGFRVTCAGNPKWSSHEIVSVLRDCQAQPRLRERIRIVESPDEQRLADLYRDADALVLPSYHEGYSVPVVEALSAGCHVIAYDAGNLPTVMGGLGVEVSTGDVDGLADAMEDWIRRVRCSRSGGQLRYPSAEGDLPEDDWRRRVRRHLADYSESSYERGFLELLRRAAALRPAGTPEWLTLRARSGAER
jgi:glycosyltransferase involved in cell wall biosynthesis